MGALYEMSQRNLSIVLVPMLVVSPQDAMLSGNQTAATRFRPKASSPTYFGMGDQPSNPTRIYFQLQAGDTIETSTALSSSGFLRPGGEANGISSPPGVENCLRAVRQRKWRPNLTEPGVRRTEKFNHLHIEGV